MEMVLWQWMRLFSLCSCDMGSLSGPPSTLKSFARCPSTVLEQSCPAKLEPRSPDRAKSLTFAGRLGWAFSQDEIKSLFRNADGSGKISFSDYLEYTERQYEAIAQKREDEKARAIAPRPKGRPSKPISS